MIFSGSQNMNSELRKKSAAGPEDVPRHVAIIMDGNGRWAQRRGFPRRRGHLEGIESVRAVVEECVRHKVEQLTLYAFSTENWRRPPAEVRFLMGLLQRFIVAERKRFVENNLRLRVIGRLEDMPAVVRKEVTKTIEMCVGNTGMIVRLALNYGGRQEIVDAARQVALAARNGLDPNALTEKEFARFMYDEDMTDPDLLIRTGGEQRLSNFLLWQLSYAELWFTRICWPEFRALQLRHAFQAYAGRDRRYGGLLPSRRRTATSRSSR
jgi:undecaprenyl diphosphate synthase